MSPIGDAPLIPLRAFSIVWYNLFRQRSKFYSGKNIKIRVVNHPLAFVERIGI
jgi:hypothetical protein